MPCFGGSGDGGTHDEDVLDDAHGFVARELEEGVKYDTGTEGKSDEGNRADAEVAVEEDVGEDEAGCFSAVEGVGPGVVDEVAEFCQYYKKKSGYHVVHVEGLRNSLPIGHWRAVIRVVMTVA